MHSSDAAVLSVQRCYCARACSTNAQMLVRCYKCNILQVLLLVTQLLAFLASFSCGPLFSSVLFDASNRQAHQRENDRARFARAVRRAQR